RFLSIADDGRLVFGWHGELYTLREGRKPRKLAIRIRFDGRQPQEEVVSVNGGLTEGSLSPNGKEYAYVFRGEIFVSSVESGRTKRLTNTAHQERSLSWHPDGRRLLYAAEVDQSWDLLETSIVNDEEPYFFTATELKTNPVVATAAEEFQPAYSPDGKKIAYLKDRTTIIVHDSVSGKQTMVLGPEHNYSYSDGDMDFAWSPDSRYLVANFGPPERVAFFTNIALLDVAKTNEPMNLTRSGYSEGYGKFSAKGDQVYYYSVREGGTSENGWPAGDGNFYTVYLTRAARDRAKLSKEEFGLLLEREKEEKKATKEKAAEKDSKGAGKVDSITIELADIFERTKRLTPNTSSYGGHLLSPDGEQLYFLRATDGKFNLYERSLREGTEKQLAKLDARGLSAIELTKDGKTIFLIANGSPLTVGTATGKVKRLSPRGEMQLKRDEEREYIFDHAWRQLKDKFYVEDIQGVDWELYRNAYRPFLPYINNNYDFAEMLSEML
ncbi:MAG: peptidase S41, partial [Bacteroidota bacterium]